MYTVYVLRLCNTTFAYSVNYIRSHCYLSSYIHRSIGNNRFSSHLSHFPHPFSAGIYLWNASIALKRTKKMRRLVVFDYFWRKMSKFLSIVARRLNNDFCQYKPLWDELDRCHDKYEKNEDCSRRKTFAFSLYMLVWYKYHGQEWRNVNGCWTLWSLNCFHWIRETVSFLCELSTVRYNPLEFVWSLSLNDTGTFSLENN